MVFEKLSRFGLFPRKAGILKSRGLAWVRLLRLGIALNCGLTILKLNMAHG